MHSLELNKTELGFLQAYQSQDGDLECKEKGVIRKDCKLGPRCIIAHIHSLETCSSCLHEYKIQKEATLEQESLRKTNIN